MKLAEHKAIVTELMNDTIEPTRKTELLMKLGDDYGIVQADVSEKSKQLETTVKERDYYSEMSKRLWLENSSALSDIETGKQILRKQTSNIKQKELFKT